MVVQPEFPKKKPPQGINKLSIHLFTQNVLVYVFENGWKTGPDAYLRVMICMASFDYVEVMTVCNIPSVDEVFLVTPESKVLNLLQLQRQQEDMICQH